MFRTIDDFKRIWDDERKKTLALLDAIPTAKLSQAVGDGRRTLGRLAWHLVESCVELPSHLGLAVKGPAIGADGFIAEPVPAEAKALRERYAESSASVAEEVGRWKDAELEVEDELYHERWKRGFSLFVLVTHQAHHRGQMTVLMRQAGLQPPEVYGPTIELWPAYGLSAPAV